jgi:nicotinate phosphoribosyltransferase
LPIIDSLLDTDLYKLSMQQIALNRFTTAHVVYEFKCRNKGIDLRPYAEEVKGELQSWAELRFQPHELDFLRTIRWFKPGYIDFLSGYKPRFEDLNICTIADQLEISVAGNWAHTILWEVPLLAIVNEVYFRNTQPADVAIDQGTHRLWDKIDWLKTVLEDEPETGSRFRFTEFGTRRRYSRDWQKQVVKALTGCLSPEVMLGTSNVLLAMELNVRAFGTMAREYLQACQAYAPLPKFLEYALDQWAHEYRGDLGIALSDVVGMDAFLRAFDLYCCKLFDGARHDSGDPAVWCNKLIEHYKKHRIDPRTKTAVFSDGLTLESAWELTREFADKIQVMHGIGTSLTNDMGFPALNIVMKLVECNGQPVAKLSDSPGKTMCKDRVYLAYLAKVFGLENLMEAEEIRDVEFKPAALP